MDLTGSEFFGLNDPGAEVGATHQAYGAILPMKDGHLGPTDLRLPVLEFESLLLPMVEQGFGLDRETPLCAAATRYCTINSNGDVLACSILPCSGGNLQDRSLRKALPSF